MSVVGPPGMGNTTIAMEVHNRLLCRRYRADYRYPPFLAGFKHVATGPTTALMPRGRDLETTSTLEILEN
jgi:hypothetical protein